MAREARAKARRRLGQVNVLIVGLGRFGSALALELMKNGHEVLGIDSDERLVQNMSTLLTQTMRMDSTDETALNEIAAGEFDAAVVAIGADLESSILTASLLLQSGVKQVWAKANSQSHGKILTQLGVHHVVFPEDDMGRRVAHQVSGESLDYVLIDEDFVMVKATAPESFANKDLAELKIRSSFGVTVVAIKKGDAPYTPAFPDSVIELGDVLVVAGPIEPLDAFCQLV